MVLTLWLIWSVIVMIDERVMPLVPKTAIPAESVLRMVPGAGVVIFFVAAVFLGMLTRGWIGRTLIRFGERLLERLPIVRSVYSSVKQITDTVFGQNNPKFEKACLVEYPRKDVWAIAFISTEARGEIAASLDNGDKLLSLFLPTTPNPTSGFLLFARQQDVVMLDMKIEDAAKLVISAGLVYPHAPTSRSRPLKLPLQIPSGRDNAVQGVETRGLHMSRRTAKSDIMSALILHTLEAQSARLSATLDARPELGGALWRRLIGVAEAAANLSMEDVPVPEQDILMPELGSALINGDPQAAMIARTIHNFLLRPGDIHRDPERVFTRAISAGRLTSLVDEEQGGRVARLSAEELADWDEARQDFVRLTRKILRHEAPVLFRLIAFSGAVSRILPERIPIAERLIFMAAESTLRREACLSDMIVGLRTRDTDLRVSAHWTLSPALALSRGGFRAWSPASDTGSDELAMRLHRTLGFNIGQLGQLHDWMQKAEDFAGQSKRSRRRAFVQLILKCPIISADTAAQRLGITPRSARRILDDAAREGLLKLMTERRAYRLWMVPALAEVIRDQPVLPRPTLIRTIRPSRNQEAGQWHSRKDSDAAITAAAVQLDDAMANADRILARYRLDAQNEGG